MQEIRAVLHTCFDIDFVTATLSNPRNKEGIQKIKVRPVLNKGSLKFQCESFKNKQVFHNNYSTEDAISVLMQEMENFKQMSLETRHEVYTVLISKKGKATIHKKQQKNMGNQVDLSHDRKKRYLLNEGMDVPFLRDLGVMTNDHKIVKAKYDKFRQINRFLEFVEDILPALNSHKEVTILDFGCGKSYLTFAIYYYLHELMGYDIRMIGLDLKEDVIQKCNELSLKYGYQKLSFLKGDIAEYKGTEEIDMVVSLHACDTATDYALDKAVKWNAKVILSVPCCQHEVNSQIKNEILAPLLSYGLIRERISALITDAMRAEYLKNAGYDAQILEFIEMEHTPKNILIRAVKTGRKRENSDKIKRCEELLHIAPTLGKLLNV